MADDFTPHDGKTVPRDGLWHIRLRCGFTDTRVAYPAASLKWIWGNHAGDIISAKRAD